MLAIIPGLCPFDDILLMLLFPALLVFLKRKFKWCKKICKCDCHDKPRPRHSRIWSDLP